MENVHESHLRGDAGTDVWDAVTFRWALSVENSLRDHPIILSRPLNREERGDFPDVQPDNHGTMFGMLCKRALRWVIIFPLGCFHEAGAVAGEPPGREMV